MAQAQQAEVKERRQPFKRFLRMFGFPVHLPPIPVEKRLDKELNFVNIAQLNEAMTKAEREWDGLPSEDTEERKGPTSIASANYIRERIVELYSKLGTKITESIGPFTDKTALTDEGTAAALGTAARYRDPQTGEEYYGVPKELRININGATIVPKFHIPDEKEIIYPDGRSYKVAFFGARKDNPYWVQLNKDIDEICRQALEAALSREGDSQKRNNIIENVELLKTKYKTLIDTFKGEAIKFDNMHRSNLIGEAGVIQHYNVIETWRTKIMRRRLTDQQVYYTHTYKIIKPKVPRTTETEIETLDEKGDVILDEFGNPKKTKVPIFERDSDGKIVYDELKDVPTFYKRGEERGLGLDKNGWPLEVGWEGTLFNGRELRKGEVLIDLFERREPRIVPEKFIVDCDLLDVAVWIYVAWDAYRDDLRDGRYHVKAITAMDRIMTELNTPYMRHPQSTRSIKRGKQAEIKMYLNKIAGMPGRPSTDPAYVDMTLKPSHVSPAFDLRAKGRTIHMGRKYYYDVQGPGITKSTEPTISTRGAALYILHRVIEESKYWGDDPTKPGVLQALERIGAATSGFDIGPNLGPGFKRWGLPLTRNPFKPV